MQLNWEELRRKHEGNFFMHYNNKLDKLKRRRRRRRRRSRRILGSGSGGGGGGSRNTICKMEVVVVDGDNRSISTEIWRIGGGKEMALQFKVHRHGQ